jgi:hypothetical protein
MHVVVVVLPIDLGLTRARALALCRPRVVTPRYRSPALRFRRHPARSLRADNTCGAAADGTARDGPPTYPSSGAAAANLEKNSSVSWTISFGGGVGDDPLRAGKKVTGEAARLLPIPIPIPSLAGGRCSWSGGWPDLVLL